MPQSANHESNCASEVPATKGTRDTATKYKYKRNQSIFVMWKNAACDTSDTAQMVCQWCLLQMYQGLASDEAEYKYVADIASKKNHV